MAVNGSEKGTRLEVKDAALPRNSPQHQDASEKGEEQFRGSGESSVKESVTSEINVNDWSSPDDPDNPFNWPKWKRWYHSAAPALLGFAV